MVKAYLRYSGNASIGVINSRECNVALNHAGNLALTGCVQAVSVWNLRQASLVRSLQLNKATERVTRLLLMDLKQPLCAVGYSDGSVRIWNYEEAAVVHTFQGHRSSISCLGGNRAGQMIASGANDTDIVLWDLVAEIGVARLRGHVDQVTAVVFWEGPVEAREGGTAPAARLISASKDRFVRIWSIEHQLCLQIIAEHQVEVWSLALNAAQTRLVAGSSDKFLRFWTMLPEGDGSEENPVATLYGAVPRPEGQGGALSLQFGRPKSLGFDVLICQGSGKTLELFRCFEHADVKKRLKRRKNRVLLKKKKRAGAEAADDAEAEALANDDEEKVDGAEEDDPGPHAADEYKALTPHRCAAKALSMAWCQGTGMVLVGLTNNVLEAVKISPGEGESPVSLDPCQSLESPGHRTGVRSLAVSHDDSLLMSTSAEAVKIWNMNTHRCVRTMASGYGLCGMFVPGNEYVLVGTKEGHLELYDLRVGELAQRETKHSGAVYALAEQPDHKGFCTCSADRWLRFFEYTFTKGAGASCTISEVPDRSLELPDEGMSIAWAPNAKWIAIALLNNTVQLVFADTLKFYLSLYGHRLPIMCVDFSSDSQMIASGSADKNIKLWSPQFGNCHRSLRAHDESVMQVRFLPGTHYLASAGRDRELKLWDCDSYELISVLQGHAVEILALALAQDASFIVTAGSDRQIRFWKRGQEQLFLSEERAKELEDKFEQEVEREDVQGNLGGEVVALRPSRRTIESVRSTERLMEILDDAAKEVAEDEGDVPDGGGRQHPCARVVGYVNTLTASNIYEVLLALPFTHALRLLQFICQFFEAVAIMPTGAGVAPSGDVEAKALSASVTLETPCQAALITTFVHHTELAMTPRARPLLLKLRTLMRDLLQAEKDRIGLSMAGFSHLQRMLKRNSGLMSIGSSKADTDVAKPTAKAAGADGKKRKKS